MKLPNNTWSRWSKSFLRVFSKIGWSKVRYAFAFKYLSGTLLDYALKKERLILEIERKMTEASRINLIVMGLPVDIQDKLNREEITNTDELMRNLRKLEHRVIPKNKDSDEKKAHRENKFIVRNSINKGPCRICASLNFPGRFHPEEKCCCNDKYKKNLSVNITEETIPKVEACSGLESYKKMKL